MSAAAADPLDSEKRQVERAIAELSAMRSSLSESRRESIDRIIARLRQCLSPDGESRGDPEG
jgi:hypothetical protein